jgi:hypothetical protein
MKLGEAFDREDRLRAASSTLSSRARVRHWMEFCGFAVSASTRVAEELPGLACEMRELAGATSREPAAMRTPDGKNPNQPKTRRSKRAVKEGERFEAPGPQTGDTLRIILQRGPSGETIVDTQLCNRGARRDRVAREVVSVLLQLTNEVRVLAREQPGPHTQPIEKLTKGLELLGATPGVDAPLTNRGSQVVAGAASRKIAPGALRFPPPGGLRGLQNQRNDCGPAAPAGSARSQRFREAPGDRRLDGARTQRPRRRSSLLPCS